LNKEAALFSSNQLVIGVGSYSYTDVAGTKRTSTDPTYLQLPVGFGYQVDPKATVQVTTSLGGIGIANATSVFIFKDVIPLTIGGTYTVKPKIIIGGALVWRDLKSSAGAVTIALTARYAL
jgi:hypothetical protein